MKLVTSSQLVTIATISSFIFLQTLWNFDRISMFLVSSWTRLNTRCRMRSKIVQCLMRYAYFPQLRWSMASALLRRSSQKRSIQLQSRYPLKMANFSLMNIQSKFLMDLICGVVEVLLTFLRFLFSAEMIFLVKVSFLPCELRQYFFLLICQSEFLISLSMQLKLSSSLGVLTFSVVAMKWSMMSLLRFMLYLARSYFLSSFRMCSDYESVSCLRVSFILWKMADSSVFVSCRARRLSQTFRSVRLRVAMSKGFSLVLGRIMMEYNIFYGRRQGLRSKKNEGGHSQQSRILHLRRCQAWLSLPQMNSYSSSLLSLSSSEFYYRRDCSCEYQRSVSEGNSLERVEQSSCRVYLNLEDTFGARRTMLMKVLSLKLQAAARQGPAVTVIPVLRPIKPYRLSNLLVFLHSINRVPLSLFTANLQLRQLTILRNSGIFMHLQHNLAISAAVDLAP